MDDNIGVPRYSLILLTDKLDKYFFDFNLNTFVRMNNGVKVCKTSLPAIDLKTSEYADKKNLAECYGIECERLDVFITYHQGTEKKLRPVFANYEWGKIAKSYIENYQNSRGIDFYNKFNFRCFMDLYEYLLDLDNGFVTSVIDNKRELYSNLDSRTRNVLIHLRAHERLTRERKEIGFNNYNNVVDHERFKNRIKKDLLNRLKNYREFRSLYMSYSVLTQPKEEIRDYKVKKKVVNQGVKPVYQMSFFD